MTSSPSPEPADKVPADKAPADKVAAAAITPEQLLARLREPGDLTEAELDALERLDGGYPDPEPGDPDNEPAWCDDPRGQLPGDDSAADLADDGDEPAVRDILEAGFTHRYPTPGATGFRAGGPLDVMLPGAELAWFVGAARQGGLGVLSDDELIGFLTAARRTQSWQAGLELAATAELDARRAAPGGREGEHVADELAAALTLTGRSAQAQLELSRQLERLPHTAVLLAAGIIDRPRAAVIASHLCLLPDADAAEVDAAVAARAGDMTTGQLGAACHRAVVAHDPLAYARRKKEAERNARVECWTEDTGTAAIAGRDLDRARTIAADKSLDQAARWLQQQGLPGTHDQLRSEAMLTRLTDQPLHTLLPPATGTGTAGTPPASGPGTAGTPPASGPGTAGTPPASGPDAWPPAFGGPAGNGPHPGGPAGNRPHPGGPAGNRPHPGGPAGNRPHPGGPAGNRPHPGGPAGNRPHPGGPAGNRPDPGGPAGNRPDPGALAGVNLTVPLSTWLDLGDRPGEISGTGAAGPADALTCRDLAGALARSPAARWCITLTDTAGRPVAHGCARAGPGPPGSDQRAWLATVKITPIETGTTCAHRLETPGYRPSPRLRHQVKIRSPRCGFPGCRRPARRCDDDHTVPYHMGGRTCECNLYPLCRHHHKCKQDPGWHLAQPRPGVLVWTAPSGRAYTVTPDPYPV